MNLHPDLLPSALKMSIALFIVLGVLLTVYYFTKRLLNKNVGGSHDKLIRILANAYVGVKKSISIVEIPGAILVIGVTGDNICLLTKIEDENTLSKYKKVEDAKISSSFYDQIKKVSLKFKKEQGA